MRARLAPLSNAEAHRFRRRAATIVGSGWAAGLVMTVAAMAWLGDVRGVRIANMQGLSRTLEVLLFPGFHVAALAWGAFGARPPLGAGATPGTLGLFTVVFAAAGLFWNGLVPWVLTALRVYLWPYRAPSAEDQET